MKTIEAFFFFELIVKLTLKCVKQIKSCIKLYKESRTIKIKWTKITYCTRHNNFYIMTLVKNSALFPKV